MGCILGTCHSVRGQQMLTVVIRVIEVNVRTSVRTPFKSRGMAPELYRFNIQHLIETSLSVGCASVFENVNTTILGH